MQKGIGKFYGRRVLAVVLAVALVIPPGMGGGIANVKTVQAAAVSGIGNANLDFEKGTDSWETTGTVNVMTDGAKSGSQYLHLEPGSSATITITGIKQGSYTLSAWVKGTGSKNKAQISVTGTGGPDSVTLLDIYLGDKWKQAGNRNVLIYNGQMKLVIESGSSALDIDNLELTMDSGDENPIVNWDFETGVLEGWTVDGNAKANTKTESSDNTDTGNKAVRIGAGGEISQKVAVEPDTRYAVTMRAKVDRQDTFKTIYHENWRGKAGETQERTSTGDRVNLGVRGTDGTVLRQVPSGTEDYSLVTLTFKTDADTTEVEIYANTIYNDAYKDSVTIYDTKSYKAGTGKLADNWTGNGGDNAYVDNFDMFIIQDGNYLRGADVSFLPAIEDLGGAYYANGVQQDCLRILSNHGVNSILGMIMVHAGALVHDWTNCEVYYHDWWTNEDGSACPLKMIDGGYFDKTHSLELGKRATELGMSYVPSFHYSDTWLSNAKGYTPEEWLDSTYEGKYSNSDISHMQSVVYNYVYDFMKTLADNNVNVAAVKHGNEQNGGVVWPVGQGAVSDGHAKIIAASYEAAEDAMPGVSGWVHSNNGYTPSSIESFFEALANKGAKMDGLAFSLYGGRSPNNTIKGQIHQQDNENMKYMDYVNVETGFSFTRYNPAADTEGNGTSMGMANYYRVASPNGQYNWLLDYMQAALDVPNPYGQTRGFYYWETDWIPTPGAGSSYGANTSNVNQRTMFNNGDTAIKEMGSSQPGRAGDMMDSMYAYLIRGCAKEKPASMNTPNNDGNYEYEVNVAGPESITLAETSITLAEGKKTRLKPYIAPADKVVTDSDVKYKSSNPAVAAVTHDGFVCAISEGKATITATVGKCEATAEVTVTKAVKASGITLSMYKNNDTGNAAKIENNANVTASLFDKLHFSASLSGNPSDTSVIYKSSNPEIASFFGETWQTPEGEMRQETEKDSKVQLNTNDGGTADITVQSADGAVSVSFKLTVSKVPVESVKLDKNSLSISYSRTAQLKAEVLPADTTRYKVRWESDNENIATVDSSGLVTGVGLGSAVIKAISDDNDSVFATCNVEITNVKAEGVSLDKTALAIQTGSTKPLTALVTPEDTYNKNVTWSSSDTSIATVNNKGEVTGISLGTATITATTEDGGHTACCKVTVQKDAIPVSGINLTESEYYFASDRFSETNPSDEIPMHRFTPVVEPEMATNSDVTWTSDTPEVATVDEYGRVTAAAPGVAKITATTQDGGYIASANVYVPSVSESFDNRDSGDSWGINLVSSGETNKAAIMKSSVTTGDNGNNILQLSGSGNGPRSCQKVLTNKITNNKVIFDFDWNVGKPVNSNGSYITITDSSYNRYLSIQTNNGAELVYSTGGTVATTAIDNGKAIGSGFNKNDTWYNVHIVLDIKNSKALLKVTSLADNTLTAEHEIALDSTTSYKNDIATIQFVGSRSGVFSWTTAIDNFNIYEAAPVPKSVTLNKDKVNLVPIEGTLMASCQLEASISPEDIENKNIIWTSSDTSVANVSQDGLVTPAKLCQSLSDVQTGSCTIRAASAEDKSVYAEIPVEVHNMQNASEFFSVIDENNNTISGNLSMLNGDKKQLFPSVTGGDGATFIAGIKWLSDNTDVVSIDDDGNITARSAGKAVISLTVTLYEGNPLETEINVEVTGNAVADISALQQAIADAKATVGDDAGKYTDESLEAYYAALEKAENDVKAALEDRWDTDKQADIDADKEALDRAVARLKLKEVPIESMNMKLSEIHLPIGKTRQLELEIAPANATETDITWSSSDTSVAEINSQTGKIIGIKAGSAVITARTGNGVTASATVNVSSDLSSYFDENGITLESKNAVRAAENAFINARTMKIAGDKTNKDKEAWTTGSDKITGDIVIDFGSDVKIDNVKTAFWSLLKYTIDKSDDGQEWTTVIDHSAEAAGVLSDATEPYVDEFPANTTARYLRINVTGNGGTGWIGITVIQVNGEYVSGKFVKDIVCEPVTLDIDKADTANLPQKATVTFLDGTTEEAAITWDGQELKKAVLGGPGEYQISGTISIDGTSYDVACTLVLQTVDISGVTIALDKESYQYTGEEIKPDVTVTVNGTNLLAGIDYNIAYANNIEIGTATITVTGIGNYTGEIIRSFEIIEAEEPDPVPTETPDGTPVPTKEPTQAPDGTPAPTEEPTQAPDGTPVPTEEPTQAPDGTPAPTEEPTQVPDGTPVPTKEPGEDIKYNLSYKVNKSVFENTLVSLDKSELGSSETATLTIKAKTGYEFIDGADISVVKVTDNCTIGSQIKNNDGSYSYIISNLSGDCEVYVSAVASAKQYIVTYDNNAVNNAKISVTKNGNPFESGDIAVISDKLELVIAPGEGYAFTEFPEVTAINATAGTAVIENGICTYIIHTFTGDTGITIKGNTAEAQYNVTITSDAEKSAKDSHAEVTASTVKVNKDSIAKISLVPESGYQIISAGITTKENTCNISEPEREANGVLAFTLSGFTGPVVINGITVITTETRVAEAGTDISVNIGAANLGDTDFTGEETGKAITDAITDAITSISGIRNIIDMETGKKLEGAEADAAVQQISQTLDKGNIAVSLEVNEETDLDSNIKTIANELLKTDIKELASKEAGNNIEKVDIAIPLDISLFAKVEGNKVKVGIKDTGSKNMVIKMKVPSKIKKEADGVNRNYYIIRFHEGEQKIIPCKYNKDLNAITFESNKFSSYILCYADATRKSAPIVLGGHTPAPVETWAPVITETPAATKVPVQTTKPSGMPLPAGTPDINPGIVPVVTETPVPDKKPSGGPSATASPSNKPDGDTGNPGSTDNTGKKPGNSTAPVIRTGQKVTVNNLVYKVTSTDSKRTVSFSGVKKKVKKVVIPSKVKISGKNYKVTTIAKNALKGNKKIKKITIGTNVRKIGKNAFNGCKKLKNIVIKTKKLKSKNVGKNAFKGISSKPAIKAPKGKVKQYKKIIKAKGAGKSFK